MATTLNINLSEQMIWQVKDWFGAEHSLTHIMQYLPHRIFHWGPYLAKDLHALNESLDHNMQNLHRGLEGIWLCLL
jgi:hypothetical protein